MPDDGVIIDGARSGGQSAIGGVASSGPGSGSCGEDPSDETEMQSP